MEAAHHQTLVGVDERRAELRGGEGWWDGAGGSLPVKAAEQKEKEINYILLCVCVEDW